VQNRPTQYADPSGLLTISIHGGPPSTGPNGSSDRGGNPGLNTLEDKLQEGGERVLRFNSSQIREAFDAAIQACKAGEPVHIVGHSAGAATAIRLTKVLYGSGWALTSLNTIDPVGEEFFSLPPVFSMNYVQTSIPLPGSLLHGAPVNTSSLMAWSFPRASG